MIQDQEAALDTYTIREDRPGGIPSALCCLPWTLHRLNPCPLVRRARWGPRRTVTLRLYCCTTGLGVAILSSGGIHDHNKNGRETGNSPGSQVSFAGPSLDLNPEGQGRGCSLRTTSISRLAKHLETLPANQLAAPQGLYQALSADSHCHQGAASGSTWTL